jgi:hypothetical protein
MTLPGISGAPLLMTKKGKTYSQFVSYVNSVRDSTAAINSAVNAGGEIEVTIDSDPSTSMTGTSWGSYYAVGSIFNRVIRHGLPSEAVFTSLLANSSVCLVNVTGNGSQASFSSLNRNGYISSSGGTANSRITNRILYWDYTVDKAFSINPNAMGTPVEFNF